MLYTHFVPVGPKQWAVFSAPKRVAEIALTRDGHYAVTSNHVSRGVLASVREFVKDLECREPFSRSPP